MSIPPPVITIEEKVNKLGKGLLDMETGFNNNFKMCTYHFSKIAEKMKMQDNFADKQQTIIVRLEDQIRELARVINDEVMYYKDRRERPPNPDMYSGGFKSRKSRRNLDNRRRKTSNRK